MPHAEPVRSIEAAARRWRRRKLIVWGVRQLLTMALAFWLFPKYPILWWSLLLVVPLALFTLYQILRIDLIAEVGRRVDENLRRLGEA